MMSRGVDTDLFSPAKRRIGDDVFRIGYVGRLTPEKNVRVFADIERALVEVETPEFEILIVGEGGERAWLERHMLRARFTGALRGEALAGAYAGIDLFVFPSTTDAFGNVVLEALASGTPAVVTDHGGPRYIVEPGVSGFVASPGDEFIRTVVHLANSRVQVAEMRPAARARALSFSWDAVFKSVYEAYSSALDPGVATTPQTMVLA
jgi:glycosyltransferase involved in cell wall biosynthesis